MSVNEKMTAIADEIRVLSGTTGTMGLDAMASTLESENATFEENLTTQSSLIEQIRDVVDSLPDAGGGSGAEIPHEPCSLRITSLDNMTNIHMVAYQNADTGLTTELFLTMKNGTYTVDNILTNTPVLLEVSSSFDLYHNCSDGAETILATGYGAIIVYCTIPNAVSCIELWTED